MQMIVRHGFVIMLVIFVILAMNMDMRMSVRVFMGMDDISMAVFVCVGMTMFVGVLQFDSVFNHKISADDHYNQGDIELDCRSFA